MDKDTTLKTRAADKITDIRAAYNELAVAMFHYEHSHSLEDKKGIAKARAKIQRLEKAYKEGREALLTTVCEKQPGY